CMSGAARFGKPCSQAATALRHCFHCRLTTGIPTADERRRVWYIPTLRLRLYRTLMAHSLSIIIPAYNEATRIGPSLDAILHFLCAAPYRAEIIVVNDGSRDRTVDVVSERMTAYRDAGHELRVLTNTPNRGKGYSVRRGVSEARNEVILFTDADLS